MKEWTPCPHPCAHYYVGSATNSPTERWDTYRAGYSDWALDHGRALPFISPLCLCHFAWRLRPPCLYSPQNSATLQHTLHTATWQTRKRRFGVAFPNPSLILTPVSPRPLSFGLGGSGFKSGSDFGFRVSGFGLEVGIRAPEPHFALTC